MDALLKASARHKRPVRSRRKEAAGHVADGGDGRGEQDERNMDEGEGAMKRAKHNKVSGTPASTTAAQDGRDRQQNAAEVTGVVDMTTMSTTTAATTSTTTRKKGVAPIKPEFVLPRVDMPATDKKTRGQNKKRGKPMREKVKLCMSVMRTGKCSYGDKCKFEHDVQVYLESKMPDIDGECPFWKREGGHCRFDVTCRFRGSHRELTPQEIEQHKVCDKLQTQESNELTTDLRHRLRKFRYGFPRSDDYMSRLSRADIDAETRARVEAGLVSAIADKERKSIDWHDKLYLAPLTTVGNLPFRRLCKRMGADITCGEMAMARNLLEGHRSEWALLRRHESEDVFGVQICGNHPRLTTKCVELLNNETDIDFIDLNCGCPIDLVYKQGAGSALLAKKRRLGDIVRGMSFVSDIPITVKIRAGVTDHNWNAHGLMPLFKQWGASAVSIHGRSRQQRYSRLADWGYIRKCVQEAQGMPVYGNGDILSFEEALEHKQHTGVSGLMLARGALIKPWIFTEIKEQRHWDISAPERFDIIKDFADYGLMHWGSDTQGVEVTRRFLLEWLSFTCRYIPTGLLERLPQRINERPPRFRGRNDLETLLASDNSADWVKITEMVLGKPPAGHKFVPKHKANSYANTEG